MKIGNIELLWLGHSGFLIKNSRAIYIDPYNITEGLEKADVILITHSHYDHCSIGDIQKIVKDGTTIIVPADAQSKITKFKAEIKMLIAEPNQEFKLGATKIVTIPAYNINKPFHPKEEGWFGYILKIGNILIYHAGDTDIIPEMQKLTGYCKGKNNFIAILPIGGRFTMSAEEAAEAANIIKPNLAIPMHYGSVVGDISDAEEFVKLCEAEGINAQILEKS